MNKCINYLLLCCGVGTYIIPVKYTCSWMWIPTFISYVIRLLVSIFYRGSLLAVRCIIKKIISFVLAVCLKNEKTKYQHNNSKEI